jgi:uncharacterized membrane protein
MGLRWSGRYGDTLPGLQLQHLCRPAHNRSLYILRSIYFKILCNRCKMIFFGVIDFVLHDEYIPEVH